MSSLVLSITSDRADLSDRLVHDDARRTALALIDHIRRVASGLETGDIDVFTSSASPVAATGTITVASVQADDTFTIGGITFTGKSSPSGSVQFDSDGADDVVAAAIAAKINAHSTLGQIVSASATDEVVTLTCLAPGVIGNFITLASSGATLTVSASALASGAGGVTAAADSYSFS